MKHASIVASVVGIVFAAGLASAGPREVARAKYKEAARLAADDDNERALEVIAAGLAAAPRDLKLLQLEGSIHLKRRDYAGALAAYQRYLDAGAKGGNRREAQRIVRNLEAVKTTFLDVESAAGPTTIYLDTRTQGVFCTTPCKRGMPPGVYKIIAERAGYARWQQRITVARGDTARVDVALVEQPSPLAIRVTPAGATIELDDHPFDPAVPVPAGDHRVRVSLAGHATITRDVAAHEGKPIELAIELAPIIPLELAPAGAELQLDDAAVAISDGGVAIPAGAHVLVARAPGYRARRIEIPAERPAGYTIAIALAQIGAPLEVAGAPAGTRVIVDGKLAGTLPLAAPIEVAPGAHAIEVRAPGYRTYRASGTFVTDQPARIAIHRLVRADRRRTYLAAASTGAMVIAGAAFSFAALGRASAYDERARLAGVTASDPELGDAKAAGQRYSHLATAGFALAAVGAGITTWLFFHEGRGESKGTLRLGVGPGGAVASGRF